MVAGASGANGARAVRLATTAVAHVPVPVAIPLHNTGEKNVSEIKFNLKLLQPKLPRQALLILCTISPK